MKKCTPERIAKLPEKRQRCFIYGKQRWVHYKRVIVKARFLKGEQIKAVWINFENEDGTLMEM